MVEPFLECLGSCCGGKVQSATVTNHIIVGLVIYLGKAKVDLAEYLCRSFANSFALQSGSWFSAISATFAFMQK